MFCINKPTRSILSGLVLLLLFSSCSSHLTIQKRRYLKGHYFSFLHPKAPVNNTLAHAPVASSNKVTSTHKQNVQVSTSDTLNTSAQSPEIKQTLPKIIPTSVKPFNTNTSLVKQGSGASDKLSKTNLKSKSTLKSNKQVHKQAGFLKILAAAILMAGAAYLLVLAFLLSIFGALGAAGAGALALLCLIGAILLIVLAIKIVL